jgi:peptide/nickel transport system permease protein
VYGYKSRVNQSDLQRIYTIDKSQRISLGFFVKGPHYKLWDLIPTDIHFFGPKNSAQPFYPFGADSQGRDVLSRLIYGARVSLSVGLVGVIVSLVLGTIIGGFSGYYGGAADTVIQRIIEFFMSIPSIPLWLGLAAAIPTSWGPVRTYFAITIILSLISWTDLARVVRGRFLGIRGEDYVLAAELDAVSRTRVVLRHMLPAMYSHIIAALTLAIPAMILSETSLSFLGLGLQAPAVSWGVMLHDAQNIRAVVTAPWLLFPGLAVMVTVLALNFVGDGLRDSADPYSQ